MLSNWRQPIAILLRSIGSTVIDGSLAASPRMFMPLASTLTCKLVNESNCEIIRGPVSTRRTNGAGGILYFSSGPVSGEGASSWPAALPTAANELIRVTKVAAATRDDRELNECIGMR